MRCVCVHVQTSLVSTSSRVNMIGTCRPNLHMKVNMKNELRELCLRADLTCARESACGYDLCVCIRMRTRLACMNPHAKVTPTHVCMLARLVRSLSHADLDIPCSDAF
ncbi:hypothetical protein PanWU01x14_021560, partial [Parasponia andersonii]